MPAVETTALKPFRTPYPSTAVNALILPSTSDAGKDFAVSASDRTRDQRDSRERSARPKRVLIGRGVKNKGPTHASDGVWQESQTAGFLRDAGSQ